MLLKIPSSCGSAMTFAWPTTPRCMPRSRPGVRSCRCSSWTTPHLGPGRWAAPHAGGCITVWPRCEHALAERGSHLTLRRGDSVDDHRGTRRADRRHRHLHRRVRRSLGAPRGQGAVGGVRRHTASDAHHDVVPSRIGAHQDRRRLQRLHAVRQRLPGPWRSEAAAAGPEDHPHRESAAVRPAGRLGPAADEARTGPAACATPGPRARPARWSGLRRS